jgi:subtilisin family serine protease
MSVNGVALRPPVRSAVAYAPGQIQVAMRVGAGRLDVSSVHSKFADASVDRDFQFRALQRNVTVLRTTPGREEALAATVRSMPGVESATRVSVRFRATATALPVNDPYWAVTPVTISPSPGPSYTTYVGQWDMHFIRADFGWGYSSQGLSALGNGVKIAIIDTGADTTHPDLQGKIVGQSCFVSGAVNPTGTDVSDLDGHGTNVAGIAASDTNNNLGFAGVGYDASLLIYKVFPNPPAAGCSSTSNNAACSASSSDIATAITNAVSAGAKVINLSLGGGNCTNGQDPDPAEGSAVANAIASGVVVVAAAGNDGGTKLIAPACDTGVLAVGATGLNNLAPNYSPTSPAQYVASYSNWDSTNANWGIVAPGGDPTACESATTATCNVDYEHWIEHIYSSQVPPATPCTADRGGAHECRVLIAGTSQATPHVSGAVALILGAKPTLTPAAVKLLLCATSDQVTGTMIPANGTTKPAQAAGCGVLDVYRALSNALGQPDPGGSGSLGT